MGQFASEQEVYDDLGAVLKNAVAGGDAAARLKQTDAIVQYRVTDPTATITLDARTASDMKIDLGETQLEPEIVFSLPADTAQKLFAGDLALTEALAAGEIASKGPVGKMLKLLPAIGAAAATEQPASETAEEVPVEELDAPSGEDDPPAEEVEAPAEESSGADLDGEDESSAE